jgi:hypothetical protein
MSIEIAQSSQLSTSVELTDEELDVVAGGGFFDRLLAKQTQLVAANNHGSGSSIAIGIQNEIQIQFNFITLSPHGHNFR